MKNVRLVRHGESAANVGAATLDHASIPLTEKGIEQAKRVAQSVGRAPELIVASPFTDVCCAVSKRGMGILG